MVQGENLKNAKIRAAESGPASLRVAYAGGGWTPVGRRDYR